jgi:hypothetical protein
MRKLFVMLLILALVGITLGQRAVFPGQTNVRIFIYLQTSAGVPVTDLADEGDGVNTTLRMSFAPTFAKASAIGVVKTYYNASGANDGLLHAETDGTSGHADGTVFPMGGGYYRVDCPDTFWDFLVTTEVLVQIEDTSAEAMQSNTLFLVGVPVNTVLANGTVPPALTAVADAVWDRDIGVLRLSGSAGDFLYDMWLNDAQSGWANITATAELGTTSTNNSMIFVSAAGFANYDPIGCQVKIVSDKTYHRMCVGWDPATFALTIFPSLPTAGIPGGADTLFMKLDFTGLSTADLAYIPK